MVPSPRLQLAEHFIYLGNSILSVETDVNISISKAWTAIDSLSIFTQSFRSGRIWHKVNFSADFNRFDFRLSLL